MRTRLFIIFLSPASSRLSLRQTILGEIDKTLLDQFGPGLLTRTARADTLELSRTPYGLLASLRSLAESFEGQFMFRIEDSFSARDVRDIAYFRFEVVGEGVGSGPDWNSLNLYEGQRCPTCRLPCLALPNPYVVSGKQLRRRTMDGWCESIKIPAGREIFDGEVDVTITSERVLRLLSRVAGSDFETAPVQIDDTQTEVPPPFRAFRPVTRWGDNSDLLREGSCPECGEALLSHVRRPPSSPNTYSNRLSITGEGKPDAEIFASKYWYGDRRDLDRSPRHDTFISGRLYSLLLSLKIKGLAKPSIALSAEDGIVYSDSQESSKWMKTAKAALELNTLR